MVLSRVVYTIALHNIQRCPIPRSRLPVPLAGLAIPPFRASDGPSFLLRLHSPCRRLAASPSHRLAASTRSRPPLARAVSFACAFSFTRVLPLIRAVSLARVHRLLRAVSLARAVLLARAHLLSGLASSLARMLARPVSPVSRLCLPILARRPTSSLAGPTSLACVTCQPPR